jgi:hypothetical protein
MATRGREVCDVSAPVISSIRTSPNPVPAGQRATITVEAIDPDGREILAEAAVMDPAGNSASTSFTFMVSDALSYRVTVDTGAVTQDPSDPAVFIWSPGSG